MSDHKSATGPLSGLRVLDLSRILAAPTCTQLLGDLGADVWKIERPGRGDDTRGWGPPFLKDREGRETRESAYYLAANRNKRSLALDLASPEGVAVVRRLAERADVLVENFKVGDLARRGLGWDDLSALNPRLVYCSVTGFGQTGPYAKRAGYDYLAQGMGGIMSVTGRPEGDPTKIGVGISDIMTGMYAATAILAALRARDVSGRGQRIDLALLDSQIAWLANVGTSYLVSGETPRRLGNAHPTIVPYDTFPTSDGWVILAVGNDTQFARLCAIAGRPELAEDSRFQTNTLRVRNRAELDPILRELTPARSTSDWIAALEPLGVPCGPVNDVAEAFADPHALHRGARVRQSHPLAGEVETIGNPIKMSGTPVDYRRPPPMLGQHSAEILLEAGFSEAEIAALAAAKVVEGEGL